MIISAQAQSVTIHPPKPDPQRTWARITAIVESTEKGTLLLLEGATGPLPPVFGSLHLLVTSMGQRPDPRNLYAIAPQALVPGDIITLETLGTHTTLYALRTYFSAM